MKKIKIMLLLCVLILCILFQNKCIANEVLGNNSVDNLVNDTNKTANNMENECNIVNSYANDSKKNEITNKSNEISIQNESSETSIQNESINKSKDVAYSVHVQNIGWQNFVNNGITAGTVGSGLRMESIKIELSGYDGINIEYQVHVQNIGWQSWKKNGEIAGTCGQSLRVEGIKIKLSYNNEYSVMYRTQIQNIGWQEWKKDGELAGTTGKSLRLEAIQIKIIKKECIGTIGIENPENNIIIRNRSNLDINGWKNANTKNTYVKAYIDNSIEINDINYYKRNDIVSTLDQYGTKIENNAYKFSVSTKELTSGSHKITCDLYTENGKKLATDTRYFIIDDSLAVSYNTHVQDIGWQEWKLNGDLAGTQGQSKRIEALELKMYNVPENAKILYRTHVQDIGWQGWKSNGEIAGTQGQSKRVEAIQIKLENMDDYTVEYQVHIQDIGWTGWYIDGEIAGTVGKSKRIEAIRIRIVKKYKRNYKGIDVSQYNGDIDWNNVKSSGIDFVMVRVGFRGWGSVGNFKEDSRYQTNIEEAKKAGLKVGVYFVTQATTDLEAVQEANWVIERIKNYEIDYPIALDIESSTAPNNTGRADNLSKETRGRLAMLFCQTIKNFNYTPMVYLNVDWAKNYVDMSQLTAYDTWIANYKSDVGSGPSYSGSYAMWQYTSSGSINGINGNVDVNILYKKY